jgi:hypothetical protein
VTVSGRLRSAAYLVAAATAVLGACGNSHPAPDSVGTPAPTHSSSAPSLADATTSPSLRQQPRGPKPSRHQVTSAITTVRRYLQAWATQGPSRASRYLVASQRTTSDQGVPRISSGTVTSYRLYRWKGPTEFTLLVSMNLRFTHNPLAWNPGSNDRFVTVHRARDRRRYRMEFASGP